MKLFKLSNLSNIFFIFILFYLIYHSFNGNYSIQNYLIYKYEEKMYQELQSNLKKDLVAINMDILAILHERDDMLDEIRKRYNPLPRDGEIVLKLD